MTEIVVIGGGYAGTFAANRLLANKELDVTLVNPRPHFVERIRLHQLVAGNHGATADYARLLNPSVRLVVDQATRIDKDARRVMLASGTELRYDYLIYAVGSTAAAPTIPGVAEYAYSITEYEQARLVRDRLEQLSQDAPIVVVGAGLTGIELAAELGEIRPAGSVQLVCGAQLAPSVGAPARRSVAKQLRKLGVEVLAPATVARVAEHSVVLTDGRELPSALTVWTTGFGVPQLAADSGLRTDPAGRLLTDETLVSIDDPRIVAAGDAANPSGVPLRMSCQAAMPLAARAATTVLDLVNGVIPEARSQVFLGQCISLGRGAATIQIQHTDDTPRKAYVGGRTGAWIKEMICSGTLSQLATCAKRPTAYYFAPQGGRRADALAAASTPAPEPTFRA